ncbi:hypothetical protein ACIBG8_02920 [Nonomuraea sp. NPDC050556]|uniref:hypothetical protein n=1 Tax=Nonomuraea sp. NPDC050556 TaxID=3364369 RepID=UPI0037B6DB14
MRHPTDGTLRRLVDEPSGVADSDRVHVADCPVCLSGLAAARDDAAVAGALLDAQLSVDVDAAWQRLERTVTADQPPVAVTRTRRWRTVLRSPVVAVVGVLTLLAGAGIAAAGDWLPIFRAEQVAPVTAPAADLVKLPELEALGELEVLQQIDVRRVTDAAAARRATGLPTPKLSALPRGVTGEPSYHVARKVSAVLTFSVKKTAETVGGQLPPPPPGLDGNRFRLTGGPGLAAAWSANRPFPALVVARAIAPTVESSGVPFAAARDYLLSLPGLPENVAAQLRGFSGDGTTLPLFTAMEKTTSSPADVNGRPATLLITRDRTMAAVIWTEGGTVTAVAGTMSGDEVLSVARDLRWDR